MSSFAGVSLLADGELCPATKSSVQTTTDCGYHLLVVQDFSRLKENIPTGQSIASRPFMVGGHYWIINCYPNGESQSCAEFISLSVSRRRNDDNGVQEKKQRVEAHFGFSFIDQVEKQNPVYFRQTDMHDFTTSCWGHDKFIRHDALQTSENVLTGDSFTIRCDIMVCNAAGDGDMCHEFDSLFQSKVGADVKFEVSGEIIAAHRCVLAAQSKVFMAQLLGPMKETSGVVHIKDMEANVFMALLSFIYTDSFPEMVFEDDMEEDEMPPAAMKQGQEQDKMPQQGQEKNKAIEKKQLQWLQDLLVAADRFDVPRLKVICENKLSEHISLSSVMSTLDLAGKYYFIGLKEACLKFIQVQSPSCLQTLMATDDWDHVFTTYPSFFKELVAKLASNQQN